MKESVYEVHNFKNEKLPFIFHPDKIWKNKRLYYNWHKNAEILFVTHGEGKGLLGEDKINIKEGDICIINSNIVHSVCSDTEIVYECLIPDMSFCRENGINLDNLQLENFIRDEKCAELYLEVIREYKEENFKVAGIRCAVLNLILYIVRNYSTEKKGAELKTRRKTEKNISFAIEFMNKNFRKKLAVDEIAKQSGMSKYYFLREFKKITGVTVITFLNILRCNNAEKLISKGESVWFAARNSGFDNDSYFSKVFKEIKDIRPSEVNKENYEIYK